MEAEMTRDSVLALVLCIVLALGATPTLAHNAAEAREADTIHTPDNGWSHEITSEYHYEEVLKVDHDIYAKAGWWGGDVETGVADQPIEQETGALSVNGGGLGHPDEMIWLWLRPDSSIPLDPYEIDVAIEGDAVVAVDVFKYYKHGSYMTPNCPQTLVEEFFPGENEGLAWPFRVERHVVQHHQREVSSLGDNQMRVRLAPSEAPEGYIVAVYPQFSTTAGGETTTITAQASISNDRFNLYDNQKANQQPELLYHYEDEWGDRLSNVEECVNEGLVVPFVDAHPGPGVFMEEQP